MSLISAPPASLNNVVPFTRPPVSGLNWGAAARGGGIAFGVGLLGAYILDKAQEAGDKFTEENLARAGIRNPNTGMAGGKPPFVGGQSGVGYRMVFEATITVFENQPQNIGRVDTLYARGRGGQIAGFQGAIAAIGVPFVSGAGWSVGVTDALGAFTAVTDFAAPTSQTNNARYGQPRFVRLERADNQADTGGNPPSTLPDTFSGYTGTNGESLEDRQKKPIGAGPLGGVGFGSSRFASGDATIGVGIGGASPKSEESNDFKNKIPDRFPSGLSGPLLKPFVPPVIPKPPTPLEKPPVPKKKEEEKKVPPPPLPPPPVTPPSPEVVKLQQDLALIIGALAAMKVPVDNINANTQPEAQRLNAKNGSCDALNSPSCTQNLKDDIKNPINEKLDQKFDLNTTATTAILGNQATQNVVLGTIATEQQVQKGVLASIAAKATDIFNLVGGLWNNSLIDKAMQYITLITVIHNAAMLSRGIADTLGSALDSGLQALGLVIKDKDGNQQGVTAIIGKSFENFIKGVIGAENYTALTNTWIQANRIYQTGINLLSNVQSILDSTTAVAELTSNRVGTLMNSLRNAGVVREDAYRSQSPNTTRFNAFMNKLENLEQGTSNIASITGNIVSVQQSVNELKTNRTEFENAINNKNTVEESAKTEKREESVFKIGDFSIVKPPEDAT